MSKEKIFVFKKNRRFKVCAKCLKTSEAAKKSVVGAKEMGESYFGGTCNFCKGAFAGQRTI